MPTTDKRIDAYIAKSAPFAQPILKQIRATVHEGCPDVEETMKWSFPHFQYKGMLCSMASFKEHCAFGFWKGSLVIDDKSNKSSDAMGQLGRITSPGDLPSRKVLLEYIRKAAQLNDDGVKVERKKPAPKKPLVVPPYFSAALKKNKKAATHFEEFSPSGKREYVDWITEAKTDATRDRRLETAIAWIAEGKARNWKYERC